MDSGTRAHSQMQLENHVKTKQCTKLQASKPCCERIKFKTKLFKIVNEDAKKCVNPSESERKHWCEFPRLHPVVTF